MDYDLRLIEEVKKYPELYDATHRNHKNKEIKATLWRDVSYRMRKRTDEDSVKTVRMRWKSLRDSYVKEIKYKMAVSTGSNVKPRKNWRYSDSMTFLTPHLAISFPRLRGKQTAEEPEERACSRSNDEEGHFLGALLNFSKHNMDKEDNDQKNTYFQETVTSFTTPSKNEHSDIDAFFRGVAETVKKLNVVNQVLVQRNIVHMVLDFKLREARETFDAQCCDDD